MTRPKINDHDFEHLELNNRDEGLSAKQSWGDVVHPAKKNIENSKKTEGQTLKFDLICILKAGGCFEDWKKSTSLLSPPNVTSSL